MSRNVLLSGHKLEKLIQSLPGKCGMAANLLPQKALQTVSGGFDIMKAELSQQLRERVGVGEAA